MFYVIYSKIFHHYKIILILLSFNPLGNYYDAWIEVGIKLYFYPK